MSSLDYAHLIEQISDAERKENPENSYSRLHLVIANMCIFLLLKFILRREKSRKSLQSITFSYCKYVHIFTSKYFWKENSYNQLHLVMGLSTNYVSNERRGGLSNAYDCLLEWFFNLTDWKSLSMPNPMTYLLFNIKSHQVTKRIPHGVGISRKSMVDFEGLWTHNNFWNFFGPEVNFEMTSKFVFSQFA